ncbi:tetratricopeptide repeat protein [Altericista sp. CCNU0014]|uniref:tetratricopeptide repeat protein n=1 Tax=Altericista sp. CCNU0014 TaxID=3082949 RepID=UPI00384F9CEF
MNWLQTKLKEWFSEPQPSPEPKGGALVKRYGDNLQDPNALIHRANKRATGGDVEGAFADLKEAIQLSPTRATAYYNRGFLHNTLGNFEAAIEDFNRALELLPDYDEAFYQRGNSHLQLKDPASAIDDFSRTIALNPYSIKAYYKRAEAYAEVGDAAGTLADYAQAITRVPKDANAYYQRGRFLSKIGEMRTAIEDFTTALAHNPRHADAYCGRGCCYAELGDLEKANLDFNQALLHNPSHQAAYYQRMYSIGILKEAAANLQGLNQVFASPPPVSPVPSTIDHPVVISAELVEPSSPPLAKLQEISQGTVKLEPDSIAGYFERATKRAMNGDLDGAIADYTQIIDQDPHNTQAYYRRGQNYSAIGEDEAALADLNQAIHWARVHSLGQLKDFSGALSETIQTLKTELKKPKPSAASSATSGMPIEEAIADYTRTLETNPTAGTYFKRAQSRALIGDLQGAIADYSEAIRLNPDHPDAYYRRGLHRSALGDTAGATQDLNRAILCKPMPSGDGPSSGKVGSTFGKKAQAKASSANLNPSRYCNHAGNRPGNRFCIHCGETLMPTEATQLQTLEQSQSAQVSPPLSEALPLSESDRLFQRGRSRCVSGNLTDGLADLGDALRLFLSEQNMGRYQETLKIIQQFSRSL